MKKILSLILCTALCLSVSTTCFALNDVSSFEPYVNGYSDGTVRPNGEIQRCEIAKILSIITNASVTDSIYELRDVPKDYWAYSYIYGVVSLGIMDVDNVVTRDGSISPNTMIHAIYSNTNISDTPTNLIAKTDYVDALPNKNEIYSFIAAINKSANSLASITGDNIMGDNGFQANKFDNVNMDAPSYNIFTVALFLEMLKYGSYTINYDNIATALNCTTEELTNSITNSSSEIFADFRPADRLTRLELAKSLYEILDGSHAQTYYTNAYSDIDSLTEDERIAVNYLTEHGVINGKGDGLFHPNDTITRAEVVVMINRAFGDKLKAGSTNRAVPYDLQGHWSEQEFLRAMA